MKHYRRPATLLLGIALVALLAAPASAGTSDRDGDKLPDTWEQRHNLPTNQPSGSGDPDRDGLTNLQEFNKSTQPRDEDTDNDGAEDGFEVRWRLRVRDADSNDDSQLDGDEDRDRDGVDNEDEDDLREPCGSDDEDRDDDNLDNEDENDFRLRTGDSDSDDDGVVDGDEDRDRDGMSNEDEDDDEREDDCDSDSDDDGRDDEDEEDTLGMVVSYNAETGVLTVETLSGVVLTLNVTDDVEIEVDDDCVAEDAQGDNSGTGSWEPTLSDLTPGTPIGEFEVDFEDNVIEEIEIGC